ncbi:MAG TPA: NrsF family protein [Thermoanaerobaculia bacterium]|nr:NrsF family protein [Thermoanaerobaculia bacterium]
MTKDGSFEKLKAEVARDLAPVRPLRPAWARALVLFPCAFLTFALIALVFGPHWETSGLVWAMGAFQVLVAYGILWVGLREAVPGEGPGAPALALAALTATVAVAAANALLVWLRPVPGPPGLGGFSPYCFKAEILMGLPAVALGFWLAARGFPLRPAVAGVLGGLSAGVAAAGVWSLYCPFNSLSHLASHLGPIVVVACAGLLAGALWARRRRARRNRL